MIRSIILGVSLFLAATFFARAHSWYDGYCCNDKDCNAIPVEQITQTSDGFVWSNKTGSRLFRFDDPDLKPSQDGSFHGCELVGESARDTEKRCLYIPLSG